MASLAAVGLAVISKMVRIACVVVCLVAVCSMSLGRAASAQDQAGGATDEKTVLRGTVINSVTGQPIGRALVQSTDNRFATMTNERGRFEMTFKVKKTEPAKNPGANISTAGNFGTSSTNSGPTSFKGGGSFVVGAGQGAQAMPVTVDRPDFLVAKRVGFLSGKTSQGDAVSVAHDQDEVTLPLTPEAKVIGHVTIADGEGAAGIPLQLYSKTMLEGRPRWVEVGSTRARSDGEFRFADLEAGEYKLFSAELQDRDPVTSDPRGQGYGYPPDYFPGASDFAGGAVIHLAAGETFQAILTPEKRRYYPVHIGVVGGSGDLGVEVERDGHPGPGFSLGYDFRDGSIGGMLPDGNYRVRVQTQNDNGLSGVVNLSVHGAAAAGMVTMLGGTDIEVRVNKEFQDLPEAPGAQPGVFIGGVDGRIGKVPIQLRLVPAQEFNLGGERWARPTSDPESEGLVISGVPAGEYRVGIVVPGGYVAAARCGDRDLLDSMLVIAGGASQPPIEVTIRNDGGEIDGSIAELARTNTPGDGAVAKIVYVVPVRAGGEVKVAVPDANGKFQVAQLAPGSYHVIAFDRNPGNLEYWNDDALRKYDAPVVSVGAREKAKIQVALNRE